MVTNQMLNYLLNCMRDLGDLNSRIPNAYLQHRIFSMIANWLGQSAGRKASSQTGELTMVLGLFKVAAQQGFASVKTTVAKLCVELSECVGCDFKSSMVNILS